MEQVQSEPEASNFMTPAEPATTEQTSDWTFAAVYTLGFLTLISTFNYLDRTILGLALPAIKAEMNISDTMLGLVSGLAFVAFYSVLGIPIAWLADRYSRRNIIAIGLAFWSAMTLLTGFVANVWQLAGARFLMGAGEACGLAPSNSMISDLVRPARRPLAMSIFGMAFSIASIVFYPIVGWIGQHHGWRAMFISAGVPGLILALAFLTVKEPARGAAERSNQRSAFEPASLAQTLRFLFDSRAFLFILLGSTFMGANTFAAGIWTPTFLMRVHHFNLAQVGATIGPVRGFLGAAGVLAGGILTDRLGQRDPSWRLRAPAIACIALGPAEALFLLTDPKLLWMTGLALTSFLMLLHMGPVFAVVLNVTHVRMRAIASAIMALCATLLGQAVGPLLVGFLNDLLTPSLADDAVRYSLLINTITAIGAGVAFLAALPHLERDAARVARAE